MVKILIYSHSPFCRTGFGIATKYLAKGLAEKYEVEIFGIIPREYSININVDNIKHLGLCNPYSGSEWLLDYCKENIDVVITHIDTWLNQFEFLKKLDKRVKLLQWAVIDHSPVSPVVIESLRRADLIVAMTRFAQNELLCANLKSVIIPLGVDLINFKQINKNVAKSAWGYDSKFVVLWNAQNHYRKGVEELVKAWEIFSKDKYNVLLHIHTNSIYTLGKNFESYNLNDMIRNLENVVITTSNFSDEKMNLLYNSADVYLNTSYGGSYELPIAEAMACKVPVIAPNSTAMGELVELGRGLAVKCDKIPNYHIAKELLNYSAFTDSNLRALSSFTGYQFKPVVEDIVEKMNMLYYNPELRMELAEKAYEFIKDRSWDKIVKRWMEII